MKRLLVKDLKSTFISQHKIKTKNKKIKALITNNRHLKMNHRIEINSRNGLIQGHNVYVTMQQHMFVAYYALFTAKKIVTFCTVNDFTFYHTYYRLCIYIHTYKNS